MKNSIPAFFTMAGIVALSMIFHSSKEKEPMPPVSNDKLVGKAMLSTHPVKMPVNIDFAGERVPLEIFDVKERLDRELLVNTYWHSNSLQLFKLASRWLPVIEKILKEQGVPEDFKYMALAESGLRNEVSNKDAVGIWQFLKGTGKECGLEIENSVDERYDIEKSTLAACSYLKKSHEDLGNWTLAAASYNMGKPRLKRILKDQKVNSYYDLYVNDETGRYVFRIIAMKEILTNPEKYGFSISKEDLYEPISYRTVTVDHPIEDLAKFAIENGTNYKMLKLLNPWLRDTSLRLGSQKTYDIKIPS